MPELYALYETPFGRKVWEFMKRPYNVDLMEYATSYKRPAVEPLQWGLLAEFDPQKLRRETARQMIGDMAGQIMYAIGYEKKGKEQVRADRLFGEASRYHKL